MAPLFSVLYHSVLNGKCLGYGLKYSFSYSPFQHTQTICSGHSGKSGVIYYLNNLRCCAVLELLRGSTHGIHTSDKLSWYDIPNFMKTGLGLQLILRLLAQQFKRLQSWNY
jgi:hypothetical protein